MKGLFRRRQSSPTLESLTQQMGYVSEGQEASSSSSRLAAGLVGMPVSKGPVQAPDWNGSGSINAAPLREQYGFHSTCLQVKDPKRSMKFYAEVLGMELVKETESDDYSMYFLGFRSLGDSEVDFGNRVGLLQLVHVHGTEDDDSFAIRTGDPGFSHFSITVPDVDRARIRMEGMGVEIVEDGSNARGFAAIADPDGYHIQLMSQSIGQDDRLRAQLEKLMSNPGALFTPTLPSNGGREASESLRFAKGGSPVSPSSPKQPTSPMQSISPQQAM